MDFSSYNKHSASREDFEVEACNKTRFSRSRHDVFIFEMPLRTVTAVIMPKPLSVMLQFVKLQGGLELLCPEALRFGGHALCLKVAGLEFQGPTVLRLSILDPTLVPPVAFR